MIKVLGIETSCDETSASIVTNEKQILSNIVLSQYEQHQIYGGVVPEIAAREHISHLDKVIAKSLEQAQCKLDNIDAIAVTAGPGLIGGVIVGVMQAKAMAAALNKPIIAVNHLEAHALTARLTDNINFPFLLLLLSGGHCQILAVKGVGDYELIGQTIDDALGEAYDKLAKMLGLGLPGGPKVEQLAKQGDANKYNLPKPLLKTGDKFNFSFSGLKTAVKHIVDANPDDPHNICASFEATIIEVLKNRTNNAIRHFKSKYNGNQIVIAGGVAANQAIKSSLTELANTNDMDLITPPIKLCTDNAAMIAWAGVEKYKLGQFDSLDFKPRARWPLCG